MSIQEVIREGMKPYLRAMITASHYNNLSDSEFDKHILGLLKYQSSQGAVIVVGVTPIISDSPCTIEVPRFEPLIEKH